MRAYLYNADHTEQLDLHRGRYGERWHTHAYCDLEQSPAVGDVITVIHPYGRQEQFRIADRDTRSALAVAL